MILKENLKFLSKPQISPAKNDSLNRFINAVVRFGSASVRPLNKNKKSSGKGRRIFYGGDGRTWTGYLDNANVALSQVSYAPITDVIVSQRTWFYK